MLKILTVAGTRPELIRLSVIIKKLDLLVDHVLVYTNQNYDPSLSTIFFEELDIRRPDYYFENKGYSIGQFLSNAFMEFEKVIIKEKPDKVLILGDTNSGLLALIANKYNTPIYHMEAGNRCFSPKVPEEVNRKVIDGLSTVNLPYTENSKENLLREGFHKNYVFKTGNPIYEVLKFYDSYINNSNIINNLCLKEKEFVLVTAHRSENVDNFESLSNIMEAINEISNQFKVVFSLHPRTKSKLKKFNIEISKDIIFNEPLGFFDFVKLEKTAKVVISDSGTVQEECCILGVPAITIREVTERQETVECGSNILTGTNKDFILIAFTNIMQRRNTWYLPSDYLIENVSDTIINILMGGVIK